MYYDTDIGFLIKSGITTQIADTSKITVLRRRMTDFLTTSIARYLKNYQGQVNSVENREGAKAAILDFIRRQEDVGILPADTEVRDGVAKLVDIESANSDSDISLGKFSINYRQRIFSSMRYIILTAEIGESVVVKEGA